MSSTPLWQAYQVAAATGGTLTAGDWTARGFSIDTRTLELGDLFIALEAERDGHDFVPAAFEKGAAAALVTRQVAADGPQVVVSDTLRAMEQLAAVARDRNFGKRVGVTGSAGKTTTKEMLRYALEPLGAVHAAEKSFNNHIGVPLTLAALPQDAPVGVFEMGMNHAGEIRGLTTQVRPHIALITTIAEAHIEFLGSLEAIADAKAEIAEGLVSGGTMILPADSPFLPRLKTRCEEAGVRNAMTFGEAGAEARLKGVEDADDGLMVQADLLGTEVRFALAAQGIHMASNAVAALLAAVVAGVDPSDAADAISAFRSGAGRGARYQLMLAGKTVTVIDESYNANPGSMRASLAVLSRAGGRKIAVLGEMKELGRESAALHAALAPEATSAADRVYTAGDDMVHLRKALPEAVRGAHADKAIDLVQTLLDDVAEGDTVLFKGSNASEVGDLVQALLKVGQRV
ncbi:MAG: UDP-N-acetylmuramoyl-tripeptide--D-alanyl-D-alanine ligase [Pseudomonadota bacterium]